MEFMAMLASGVFGILVLVYGIQEIRHQVKNWWTYIALLLGVFLLCFFYSLWDAQSQTTWSFRNKMSRVHV
ncbi:MAG: hypothetical protein B7Z25_06640 [Aerococcus viridans]|nr:MAG: hypothetical protein B7Z25_06640 [Aerococcus viridans]